MVELKSGIQITQRYKASSELQGSNSKDLFRKKGVLFFILRIFQEVIVVSYQ